MRIKMDNNPAFMAGIKSFSIVEVPEKYDSQRSADVKGPQDTNKADVLLWILHGLWADEDATFLNPEPIKVKVASSSRPPVPDGGCAVAFTGLYQNINARRNGGFNVSYSAEKFQLVVGAVKAETPTPVGAKK